MAQVNDAIVKLETHDIAINILIPAEYNPRRLSKKQFADIQKSLEEFGFVNPIIVNKHPDRKNVIVGGHQRVKVASALGYKFVPAVYVNLDETKERELNVRLNKNAGEWDYDALAAYFDVPELKEWGFTEEELGIFDSTSPEDEDKEYLEDADFTIKIVCNTILQRNELAAELAERGLTIKVK